MQVRELMDILAEHPPESEIELAVIAPVEEQADDITVDRYTVEGVLPWVDDGEDLPVIWLIGGADTDVDVFLDAIEQPDLEADTVDRDLAEAPVRPRSDDSPGEGRARRQPRQEGETDGPTIA